MPSPVRFQGVYPIGDTDIGALPVKHLGPAIAFYSLVLGFRVVGRDRRSARLQRDDAEVGLAENGKDPEQASCYFAVSDVDALQREMGETGIDPTPVHDSEHAGKRYRVFFARKPYGVCFCFGQPATDPPPATAESAAPS